MAQFLRGLRVGRFGSPKSWGPVAPVGFGMGPLVHGDRRDVLLLLAIVGHYPLPKTMLNKHQMNH